MLLRAIINLVIFSEPHSDSCTWGTDEAFHLSLFHAQVLFLKHTVYLCTFQHFQNLFPIPSFFFLEDSQCNLYLIKYRRLFKISVFSSFYVFELFDFFNSVFFYFRASLLSFSFVTTPADMCKSFTVIFFLKNLVEHIPSFLLIRFLLSASIVVSFTILLSKPT